MGPAGVLYFDHTCEFIRRKAAGAAKAAAAGTDTKQGSGFRKLAAAIAQM